MRLMYFSMSWVTLAQFSLIPGLALRSPRALSFAMAVPQDTLEALWKGGQLDRMCAWEQCRALALKEAYMDLHGGELNVQWVCDRVCKNDGTHPQRQSLHEFFDSVDKDKHWFPGKHSGKRRGPQPVFTLTKKRRCAKVMMQVKTRGGEPTLEEMKLRCRGSTTNPSTGAPFDDKLLRSVFSEFCYDLDPEYPWRFQARLQKRFLPPSTSRRGRFWRSSRSSSSGPT